MNAATSLVPGKYRLRVSDYLMLDEAGAFRDSRTALVDGEIRVLRPQFRPHARLKTKLYDLLKEELSKLETIYDLMSEASVELDEHSMVEPDLLLTSEPDGKGPVPIASVGLAIEVADTTLRDDLEAASLYARAGVPEYWVADVNGRKMHRFWSPTGDAYAFHDDVAFGERLNSQTVADLTIATERL